MEESPLSAEDELEAVVKSSDISGDYTISWDQKLGEGLSGFVRQCTSKETEEIYALKCLPDDAPSRLEIGLQLKCRNSGNIVAIKDVYQNKLALPGEEKTSARLLVVMECMNGGELFDRISRQKRFTEREASHVTKQIAQAIQYCHSINIAHRDIKPENLLLKDRSDVMTVKLTDFGFAKVDHGNLATPHFTPYYVSPQILQANKFQKAKRAGTAPEGITYTYDKSCDLWSLGVILYIMLCGYPPFYSEVPSQLFSRSMELKILRGEYDFPEREWNRVSAEAKTIVSRLLHVDPVERLTVEELLNSSWLNNYTPDNELDLHASGIIRNQMALDAFKAGHSATLHDLRVPEKNAELQKELSCTMVTDYRASSKSRASKKYSSLEDPTSSTVKTKSPSFSTKSKKDTKVKEDTFLKVLRDMVGHLLMPQKDNYEDELSRMVKQALKQQPEGSTLKRVMEKEGWSGVEFGGDVNRLSLAKSISEIIQNVQRNKNKISM